VIDPGTVPGEPLARLLVANQKANLLKDLERGIVYEVDFVGCKE
jgi:hypothetical protein